MDVCVYVQYVYLYVCTWGTYNLEYPNPVGESLSIGQYGQTALGFERCSVGPK